MKEQDYNQLVNTVSNHLAPVNQLLYEILIITALYIYLERIQNSSIYLSQNSSSVIIIFTILALGIDWFIWNNSIQTVLFGAILLIYIRYNMNNAQIVSSFINMTREYVTDAELFQPPSESTTKECNTLKIPEMLDLPYDTTDVKPFGIMAYDKTADGVNKIYDVYKTDQPPATITDSKYAEIMLNELYQTPQYRNNHPPNDIDSSLANDIHNNIQNMNENANDSIIANNITDEDLLESFRHPTRQFLDNKWLSISGIGNYNDNNLCKMSNRKEGKNKDVICNTNIVAFGKKLEQCSNDYVVSLGQLDEISNNEIPHYQF